MVKFLERNGKIPPREKFHQERNGKIPPGTEWKNIDEKNNIEQGISSAGEDG